MYIQCPGARTVDIWPSTSVFGLLATLSYMRLAVEAAHLAFVSIFQFANNQSSGCLALRECT